MYITGWTVAATAVGALPALLWAPGRLFSWVWVIAVLLLAVIDAWIAPQITAVGVQRDPIRAVRLTASTTASFTIANLSRRTMRLSVRDAWQPSAGAAATRHRLLLPGGQAARLSTVLTPTRRGDRHADKVTVRAEGPMRLAGRQRSIAAPARVRVLPEFRSRRFLPSRLARLREIDGQTSVHLKGAGSEFDSLREYVIGDDVRAIDWRASARRGDVLLRTYRPERDRRVFTVLDTSRLSAGRVGDAPRLDAGIEAALLLSALASHAGDRVQVTAFDRVERARAAGSSGPAAMPALADALATVEAALVEPDWAALTRLVQERLSQRALIVLLTTVDISAVDTGLFDAVHALARDHVILVASVDDPVERDMIAARDNAEALYTAGAAARAALERDTVALRLRQMGADVLTASPDDIAPAVADRYLALKASGRL